MNNLKLKFFASVVFFILVNFYTGFAYAQNSDTRENLGKNENSITITFGQPLQRTEENGFTIFWYESLSANRADLYYFKEDRVVYIVRNLRNEKLELRSYIDRYGPPEVSLAEYDLTEDSRKSIRHIWPTKGSAITTYGAAENSQAVKEFVFEPTNLKTYLDTFAPHLKDGQRVNIESKKISEAVFEKPMTPLSWLAAIWTKIIAVPSNFIENQPALRQFVPFIKAYQQELTITGLIIATLLVIILINWWKNRNKRITIET